MRFKKSIFGTLAMLPLVGLLSLTGNSEAQAEPLEETLAATGNADDHLAAARSYLDKARALEAEAVQFETAASKLGPYMDAKGFRRASMITAAQEKRADAKEMQELYAAHLRQASALHGKVQPQ